MSVKNIARILFVSGVLVLSCGAVCGGSVFAFDKKSYSSGD